MSQNISLSDASRPPVPGDAVEEARLEAAALKWCETMGAKLKAKKSGYKLRGENHADHR
jgi:hypothetical protein